MNESMLIQVAMRMDELALEYPELLDLSEALAAALDASDLPLAQDFYPVTSASLTANAITSNTMTVSSNGIFARGSAVIV